MEIAQIALQPDTRDYVQRRKKAIPQSIYDLQVNQVCQGCNGLSARDIEDPVRQVIASLARGSRMNVTGAQTYKLALWSALAVLTRALVDKGVSAIPEEHYKQILNRMMPPRHMRIWIAQSADATHGSSCLKLATRVSKELIHLHQTTFWLGHLIVFTVGCSSRPPRVVEEAQRAAFDPQLDQNTIEIWPSLPAFEWPLASKISSQASWRLSEAVAAHVAARLPAISPKTDPDERLYSHTKR